MQKKELEKIFQSYFHGKYLYKDFLNTKPIENKNFYLHIFNKHRTLCYKLNEKNSQELKNYHTFINNILLNYLQTSSSVYSYKQNHNVSKMIINHKDSKYYFKTDIKNFFGSITKDMIIDCMKSNINFLPINDLNINTIESISNIVTYNNTLPAGFVSSPNISNAILYNFDINIKEYCDNNDIVYTRYSDDLIFSSKYKLENIKTIINNLLNNLYHNSFELNEKKSKYIDKTKLVKLLGIVITNEGHLTVSKHIKSNIKKLLHFYMNDKNKFTNFLTNNYNNSLAKAYGSLNYINDIDQNFILYLRKKYGNFVVDKFLHGNKNDK